MCVCVCKHDVIMVTDCIICVCVFITVVDFKKTIEGAVQTAMDAVTLLSDDFNFNYGESEIMDDDES